LIHIEQQLTTTANDWRAIEAGAHAYAARTGQYSSLTTYEKDKDGNLVGTIELPLALGLVGGATRIHPIAQIAVKILDVKTAAELAEVIASVGLAQNFGAIRALATTGIQAGHMRLHLRNLAHSVVQDNNDDPVFVDKIIEIISKEKGKITMDRVVNAYKTLKEIS
jgi:hydroxymethylglutaryl-CoA reductase